jgi:hypothetical protein
MSFALLLIIHYSLLIFVLLNCTALSIASIIASALAIPLPAISNAVPWSTDVRMMGKPQSDVYAFSRYPFAASLHSI